MTPFANARHLLALSVAALLVATASPATADDHAQAEAKTGSVIFIHPDGVSSASWAVARALGPGPDGDLHWDKLSHIALYRGHMLNSLTSTSNGGATVHATGVKPMHDAFGKIAAGQDAPRILDAHGRYASVAIQAISVGIPVGVVQSGSAIEPGTAVFLAEADARADHDTIVDRMLESGAQVILGGGERHFLPQGVEGTHGPGERTDGRNLVEEAQAKGYTVVTTRDELLALPDDTGKVLGLFAHYHTFNDEPEEILEAAGLPQYDPEAPTVAEMTEVALRLLSHTADQFLLVVEEEGTDNFGNNNNAPGTIEAMQRTDECFGVALDHLADHPDTLVVTAADSDGGGLRLIGKRVDLDEPIEDQVDRRLQPWRYNGAPQDGVSGTRSAHFIAAPNAQGHTLPFSVAWSSYADVSGGVLVRAEGLNAERVTGSMDNTKIAELIRLTLFGDPSFDGPPPAE